MSNDLPKEFDFDPYNLPDDLLQAIGLAIACGAQTESVISMAIGGCLGLDVEYAAATTTHMTLPLKFSVLRSAAEIRIDDLDDLDKLDALLEAVDKALGKRHEIAHATWGSDPDRANYSAPSRLLARVSWARRSPSVPNKSGRMRISSTKPEWTC